MLPLRPYASMRDPFTAHLQQPRHDIWILSVGPTSIQQQLGNYTTLTARRLSQPLEWVTQHDGNHKQQYHGL